MQAGPEPHRHTLHHKSLAVLKEIRSMLELCERSREGGCLRLEVHINHGIPSRLIQYQETRTDIPLEGKR